MINNSAQRKAGRFAERANGRGIEEVPMSWSMIGAPRAINEQCAVQRIGIRRFKHKYSTRPQHLETLACNGKRIGHVFDDVTQIDEIKLPRHVEIFEAYAIDGIALIARNLTHLFVKIDTEGVNPVWIGHLVGIELLANSRRNFAAIILEIVVRGRPE